MNNIVDVSTSNILVVDDTPANLRLLMGILRKAGYNVRPANNGQRALMTIEKEPPDLILLDIMMPNMDGYQVCEHLKANEKTRDIPISVLSETFDKVKAFSVGGVDYITKPFQDEEVLARIQTHLMLQIQKKQLIQLNQEKNEFLGMAAHDLKNPLSAISGATELIEEIIQAQAENFVDKTDIIELTKIIDLSTQVMFKLLTNLLDVNAIESGKIPLNLENRDIFPLVSEIVVEYTEKAKRKNINLHFIHADNKYIAYVDINMVRQVIDNLVSNAVKYSPLAKNVYVRIFATENTNICCEIQDEGPGLSDAEQAKLFQKFSRLTPQPTNDESSTGLGLFIVKKLINAMGGKVWCESELGKGSKFMVEFVVN